MGIFLVIAGALIGFASGFLIVSAASLRDFVSLSIGIDLATVAAVLFAGGAIVLAVDKLRSPPAEDPAP